MTEPRKLNLREWQDRIATRHPYIEPVEDFSDEEQEALAAAEVAHSNATRRWHASIPDSYHPATLDQFSDRPWYPEAVAWAEAPQGRNVLLHGPVGVGKSYLAAALVRGASFGGLDVTMLETPRLLDLLRPREEDQASMDDLIDVDRLIIDDLGTEKTTEWSAERLGMIISERRAYKRPTIYTTNLTAVDLAAHIGPRSYSRIMKGSLLFRLSGIDQRGANNS